MSNGTPATWAGRKPEVVLGDDVGAAGGRVGLDRLAVAEDQEAEHADHGQGDRDDERERGEADHGSSMRRISSVA